MEGTGRIAELKLAGTAYADATRAFNQLTIATRQAGIQFNLFASRWIYLRPVALKPAHKRGRHRGWR